MQRWQSNIGGALTRPVSPWQSVKVRSAVCHGRNENEKMQAWWKKHEVAWKEKGSRLQIPQFVLKYSTQSHTILFCNLKSWMLLSKKISRVNTELVGWPEILKHTCHDNLMWLYVVSQGLCKHHRKHEF